MLEESGEKLNEAYKRDQKSRLTEQLTNLDMLRDDTIICLRTLADGYSHHYNEIKKTAGKMILQCIDKYGTAIYRMNYHAETSTLDNLGKEMKNDSTLANASDAINVNVVVDEMIRVNNEFKEIYQQRVQEDAASQEISAGEIVKEAVNHYRTLVSHIESHAIITPSAAYTKLIDEINELIAQYNAIMSQRGGSETAEEVPGVTVQE